MIYKIAFTLSIILGVLISKSYGQDSLSNDSLFTVLKKQDSVNSKSVQDIYNLLRKSIKKKQETKEAFNVLINKLIEQNNSLKQYKNNIDSINSIKKTIYVPPIKEDWKKIDFTTNQFLDSIKQTSDYLHFKTIFYFDIIQQFGRNDGYDFDLKQINQGEDFLKKGLIQSNWNVKSRRYINEELKKIDNLKIYLSVVDEEIRNQFSLNKILVEKMSELSITFSRTPIQVIYLKHLKKILGIAY